MQRDCLLVQRIGDHTVAVHPGQYHWLLTLQVKQRFHHTVEHQSLPDFS